jgi:hypothetical protein
MSSQSGRYGCDDYREEMVLLGLRHHLEDSSLSEAERDELRRRIAELQERMGLD